MLQPYFEEMLASNGAFASRAKELRALLAAVPRSALATDLSGLIVPASGSDYLVGEPGGSLVYAGRRRDFGWRGSRYRLTYLVALVGWSLPYAFYLFVRYA